MRSRIGMLSGAAVIVLIAAALLSTPAGAKTKTKTFSSGPTAIPIPDAVVTLPSFFSTGSAVSDIPVSKKGTIKDLNAAVQITHTDTGELSLYLFKGTKYILLASAEQGLGANDSNFGSGTGCAGGMTVFDGEASRFIQDGANPFDGSFLPESTLLPLRLYNGDQLKGTWRLLVIDEGTGDTGTITCFQITSRYKAG